MDTEYDWEKGTSIINEKKYPPLIKPQKCYKVHDYELIRPKNIWICSPYLSYKKWEKIFHMSPSMTSNQGTLILNPLYPNIIMHILHTVLYTFLMVLTRRIYLKIKSSFSWWSFSLISWPQCVIRGWYCKENLEASHP